MIDEDRFGPRALAWSEADRVEIFGHILGLEMGLHIAVSLLQNSAYAKHMSDSIANWQRLLTAVPKTANPTERGENSIARRSRAWAEADADDICYHLIAVLVAFETAIEILQRSGYGQPPGGLLDKWQALLNAMPPDKPQTQD